MELGIKLKAPIRVLCDNKAAIAVVQDYGNFPSTKHIEIKHLYAREVQMNGNVKIEFCPTDEMTADILTKALPEKQFIALREKMGITDLSDMLKTM